MNYKISFKTWLKFARRRMEMEARGHNGARASIKVLMTTALTKMLAVEIEVQEE